LPLLRRELFPSAEEALDALGECLAETGDYALGELGGPWEAGEVEEFILSFSEVDQGTLPAYPLLRAAYDHPPHPDAAGILLRQLIRPLPPESILNCLRALRLRHQSATAADKRAVFRIHLRYLDCLA